MEPKSRNPEGECLRKHCSEDFSKSTEMEHLGWRNQEIKRESFRGMQQPWEKQWQDFLKTLPSPYVGWEDSEILAHAPWDDPKAFLASFEHVAQACQWPRGEWLPRLLPALSGEAKRAFGGLEARDKEDYGKVKAAILRGEAIRVERQRQHFRQFRFQEIEDPRRVYGQLQRLCRQWLKPERRTKEQILELLILEQFLASLPPELQSWIRAGGSDTCSQAVALIENFLLKRQEVKEPSQEATTKSSLGEERISLDVDEEEIYKDIKQNDNGVIHLLGKERPRTAAGSSIMGSKKIKKPRELS
ncbi:SCAN domain-containing protein 3-like [Erythrolamprus reginae]|uniref:SCAN domain-containing protein 3-like n=1 Tax=Erythrolamprus reginae TaxID=121349 RepID=UPI00396C7DF2